MKKIYLVIDFDSDDYYAFEDLAEAEEMLMQLTEDYMYESYINAMWEYDWYQHQYFYRYINPEHFIKNTGLLYFSRHFHLKEIPLF